MDFLDTESRPDFATAEYRNALDLYRQNSSLDFYKDEFEILMDESSLVDFTNQSPSASSSESGNGETMEIDDNSTKTEQPTGFLDLPRELRQTILDYSYESKEVEFAEWYEAYMYVDWANVLREVHEIVAEDVDYMEKRWNRRVVIKGWKEEPVAEAANGGMSEVTRLISVRQNIHPGFRMSELEGRRWVATIS